MPVEPEVSAGDGKIRGDRQFFLGEEPEQGAVVANAETQAEAGRVGGTAPDLAEKGQFPLRAFGSGIKPARSHPLRIGQWGRGKRD